MAVKISGVLKDGTGKPVQNCTIQLKAKRNSTTVVVNTLASENPDEAGRYSMDVEYGQYSVILLVEGFPPSHAGTITVYEDSQPGTLNDFLGAMTEDDARPEALRRFELMVEEVARNASAVAQNTAAAKKSASDASTSAREAATHATDAADSARAASTSAGQAVSSAQSASSSAGTASAKATEASKSAAAAESSKSAAATSASAASTSAGQASASATAAGKSAESAASSASTATTKAGEATEQATAAARSASAAKTSETNAKASETSAESSKTAAASSASSAASSASSASASKDEAAKQASAAKGSATTASTKATEAVGSATAAAQSKSTAESAATRAETAAKRAEDIASAVALEDASTTKKGIVQLSSSTNSTSETLAATPKAVKAVMDETNKKAPLNSPALTGTPTTPTAPKGTDNTQIASTAYVMAAISALVNSSPASLDTLNKLAASLGNNPHFATTMLSALAGKQPLDDTLTRLSGKDAAGLLAYLGLGNGAVLPVGVPVPWPSATPPAGWIKCNGAVFDASRYPGLAHAYPAHRLPDLRGEFIRGWDDGRGVDTGRGILSSQADDIKKPELKYLAPDRTQYGDTTTFVFQGGVNGVYSSVIKQSGSSPTVDAFQVSGGTETRPRNIAYNYIVRGA